ncbi:MAG: hypothetical protein ACE5OS_04880 [Anaerolineae bacterium]
MRIADFWLRLAGLVLIVVGYFAPWTPHKTAALTVTGLELAKFAKFFPQVQGGVVSIVRELFYFPFVVAFVLLGLLASRSTSRAVRLIVPLCAAAVLLGALLPFSVVDAVYQALTTSASFALSPDDKGQLILVVAGVMLALLTPLAHRLPRRVCGVLIVLLALAGSVPALWQFALLRPLVVALYNEHFGMGWGLVACVTGFASLLLSGILTIAGPDRSVQPQSVFRAPGNRNSDCTDHGQIAS